ncbi:hypothetical protein V5N11_003510 [Cardamine amara subsp. amara]|uniref:Zinc knuckle CX2CX4HX4C domain-containing protein n=1 Tax=Cardamine amara subsp. amara TaxID=228776 RepID=A0ABD1C208_CARAN
MEPWFPNIGIEKPTAINFWIRICDVPLQFFSPAMVQFIANSIGHVIENDKAFLGGNATFGRVCIRWPIDRLLIFEQRYRFGNEHKTVTFRYEKLWNHCYRCHSLQHDISECIVPKENTALGVHPPSDDEDNGDNAMIPVNNVTTQSPIPAIPLNLIPAPTVPVDRHMQPLSSIEVLIDGRPILVSELRSLYQNYPAIADPSEAEARRRRILLSMEQLDPAIVQEVTRPIGFISSLATSPTKRRRTLASEASSSSSSQHRGAVGPVPPEFR